jgi:uncharacterized membrane protein YidH (DUF202 family)
MARSNPIEEIQDTQQMLIDYAKQETVEPLKSLGKYLGLGLAGSFVIFLGVLFLSLATLRVLQTFEMFSGGSWASLVPYLVAVVVLLLAILAIYQILSRATEKVR